MIYVATEPVAAQGLCDWLTERIEDTSRITDGIPLGVYRGQTLTAVAVFYNFRGETCEVALAADHPRWATSGTLSFIMGFAFNVLKMRRVTALSRLDNERAHKLIKGIGFVKEGRHRALFEDCDGFSFGMTAKWFKRSKWNGKRRR